MCRYVGTQSKIMSYSIQDENALFKRYSRPSLRQVNAVVDFMQKHPILAQSKRKQNLNYEKLNKLWVEMSNKVNSIGVEKSTKSWIKYWMDKRRYVLVKHRSLQTGKSNLRLSLLEKKILSICLEARKKNKQIKHELNNYYDKDENEENYENLNQEHNGSSKCNGIKTSPYEPSEGEEKYMKMTENMADVMEKQATAFTQMAQTWYNHSSSIERLADASYQQAVAVGRLASSFEAIEASLFDMKNAVVSIDNVLKRSHTASLLDQNMHLFA